MSSLAGALDGYTSSRHSKMHYNHSSDDVEMTASKIDSEAQDDDEEMNDDLFGNDNDIEEQKHVRYCEIFGIDIHFGSVPYFQNTCIAYRFRPGL